MINLDIILIGFRNYINSFINQLANIDELKIKDDLKNINKFLPENDLIQISPFMLKAQKFLERQTKNSLELESYKTFDYFIRSFYG